MEPKNRDVDVYCIKILHKLISQYTNMKEYHLNMYYWGVTKTKTYENEDLRPKTRSLFSFSWYEN